MRSRVLGTSKTVMERQACIVQISDLVFEVLFHGGKYRPILVNAKILIFTSSLDGHENIPIPPLHRFVVFHMRSGHERLSMRLQSHEAQ